jgi:hypothetical protein
MSASGTLHLPSFAFLLETRISRSCQEIRELLSHGQRRKSPAFGHSNTLSAANAEALPSTKKLVTFRRNDLTVARSCTTGLPHAPTRRAVRITQTHAKPCQPIHTIPQIRDNNAVANATTTTAVAKTAIITKTQTAAAPTDASPTRETAPVAEPTIALKAPHNGAPCPPQLSPGGKNS